MSSRDGQEVRIGEIVGLFGIKGAVKVRSLTDFPSRFAAGRTVGTRVGPRRIVSVHWHNGQPRIALEEIDSVSLAQSLVGTFLTVDTSDKAVLQKDEYLVSDLIGLSVVEGGKVIGKIDEVLKSPAHDLISVSGALIPCVKQFIKCVDFESRTVTVELISGMRPGEEPE